MYTQKKKNKNFDQNNPKDQFCVTRLTYIYCLALILRNKPGMAQPVAKKSKGKNPYQSNCILLQTASLPSL